MKNVLVIGNGFDIAHGLYTKYIDFYDDIQNGVPTMIITKGFSDSPGGRIETIN